MDARVCPYHDHRRARRVRPKADKGTARWEILCFSVEDAGNAAGIKTQASDWRAKTQTRAPVLAPRKHRRHGPTLCRGLPRDRFAYRAFPPANKPGRANKCCKRPPAFRPRCSFTNRQKRIHRLLGGTLRLLLGGPDRQGQRFLPGKLTKLSRRGCCACPWGEMTLGPYRKSPRLKGRKSCLSWIVRRHGSRTRGHAGCRPPGYCAAARMSSEGSSGTHVPPATLGCHGVTYIRPRCKRGKMNETSPQPSCRPRRRRQCFCVTTRAKGYRLLERRYRGQGGEIDLVLGRGDDVIFVEGQEKAKASTRRGARLGERQILRIFSAAAEFFGWATQGTIDRNPLRSGTRQCSGRGPLSWKNALWP